MIARAGRWIRTAGIGLLVLAAAIVTPASVPKNPAPTHAARAAAQPSALELETPGAASHLSARPCLRPKLAASPVSAAPRPASRMFVEDTTPPSNGALKAEQLPVPNRPQTLPRTTSPALRNSSTSVSNRQRAP